MGRASGEQGGPAQRASGTVRGGGGVVSRRRRMRGRVACHRILGLAFVVFDRQRPGWRVALGRLLGTQFYGLVIMTPRIWVMEDRDSGREAAS